MLQGNIIRQCTVFTNKTHESPHSCSPVVYFAIIVTKDIIIVAVITLQSCKILLHSIINYCVHFISLQTHGCITQTGLQRSFFFFYRKLGTSTVCRQLLCPILSKNVFSVTKMRSRCYISPKFRSPIASHFLMIQIPICPESSFSVNRN